MEADAVVIPAFLRTATGPVYPLAPPLTPSLSRGDGALGKAGSRLWWDTGQERTRWCSTVGYQQWDELLFRLSAAVDACPVATVLNSLAAAGISESLLRVVGRRRGDIFHLRAFPAPLGVIKYFNYQVSRRSVLQDKHGLSQ
jgi:hypothetical protein